MFDSEQFGIELEKIVMDYSLVWGTKITDLTLETLIVKALRRCGHELDWEVGGHGPGKDIELPKSDMRFSVKSGKENSKRLTLSSFRTTRFPTLAEKLKYFDGDGKNFNYYLVLSRLEKKACKSRPVGSRTYTARLIPADLIKASDKEWESTNSGWKSNKTDGVTLRIQRTMSDQFWFDVEQETLERNPDVIKLFSHIILYDALGSRDFEVI